MQLRPRYYLKGGDLLHLAINFWASLFSYVSQFPHSACPGILACLSFMKCSSEHGHTGAVNGPQWPGEFMLSPLQDHCKVEVSFPQTTHQCQSNHTGIEPDHERSMMSTAVERSSWFEAFTSSQWRKARATLSCQVGKVHA